MKLFPIYLLQVLMAFCTVPALAGDEGAIVTYVLGQVRAGSGAIKTPAMLPIGTMITLGPQARVVVFLPKSVEEFTLEGPGKFVAFQDGVRPAADSGSGRLSRRTLNPAYRVVNLGTARLAQGGVVMRGEGGKDVLYPSDDRIAPGPVAFRWSAGGPRTSDYRFRLFDDAGLLLYETQGPKAAAELPSSVALSPGAAYRWRVEWRDHRGQSRIVEAGFSCLSEEEQALAASLRPDASAQASAHMLYGLWLGAAGAKTLMEEYLFATGLRE